MSSAYNVEWYPDGKLTGRAKRFVKRLEGDCLNQFEYLKLQLRQRGPALRKNLMLKDLRGDVWELIRNCDRGALRIYGFTSGTTYYMTCGEIKKRNEPGQGLIEYAQKCHDEHKEKMR